MANLHEVKEHISSVESTKKITRAMYLIAASKAQKAKGQLAATLPYFLQIIGTMREILAGEHTFDTPYIRTHEVKQRQKGLPEVFLVLGADKGMAGGYHHNIEDLLEIYADKERDELLVAGISSRLKLEKLGYHVQKDFTYPVMNPNLYRAREMAEIVMEKYRSGRYHGIRLLYTEMLSAVRQDPTTMPLLPLDLRPLKNEETASYRVEEIEYVPSPEEVFDSLVPHYLKGILYGALVESFASEQNARMVAMDNATTSADETIGRLNLEYNQARQGKITQELTEIIAGIPQSG